VVSWYLWVPRNAKALKCINAATEGIAVVEVAIMTELLFIELAFLPS
jgi:hypothetical protein